VVILWLASCLRDPVAPCADDGACRDAFGFGHACGDEGFCEGVDVPGRCGATFPGDLLDDPTAYPDVVVFGSLYDAGYDVAESQSVRLAFVQAAEGDGLDGRPDARARRVQLRGGLPG
jgi:hypothetical protein